MINYSKISDAVLYYESKGYKYIEVPWIVSLDTMLITRPEGSRLFSTFTGELVASGEQSFLEMRKTLEPGKYQCVTPCFRDEPVKDELHRQWFMKNELICVDEDFYGTTGKARLESMIDFAKGFFQKYMPHSLEVINAPLANSIRNYDIIINGIEVGSYGYRCYKNFQWLYGTGCAEPRLTQALENDWHVVSDKTFLDLLLHILGET